MSIIKDKKQVRVAIPSIAIEKLNIDPEKDKIVWLIVQDDVGISLHGVLKKH